MLRCPNCNAPVKQQPIECDVCGYRAAMAREFLIVYLGGAAFAILGFAYVTIAVLIEGAGPEHWSRVFDDWFPLGLWPRSYEWLAFLFVGIVLTMGGIGMTRRRRVAWVATLSLLVYQTAWQLIALFGSDTIAFIVGLTLAMNAICMSAVACVGVSLWRLPARDVVRMQELAREKEQLTSSTPNGPQAE